MNVLSDLVAVTARVHGVQDSELLHFLCARAVRKHGVIRGIQQAFRSCFLVRFKR